MDWTDGFHAGRPRVLFSDSYRRGEQQHGTASPPDGEHFVMVSTSGSRVQGALAATASSGVRLGPFETIWYGAIRLL